MSAKANLGNIYGGGIYGREGEGPGRGGCLSLKKTVKITKLLHSTSNQFSNLGLDEEHLQRFLFLPRSSKLSGFLLTRVLSQ